MQLQKINEILERVGEIVKKDKAVLDAKATGDVQALREEIEKATTKTVLLLLQDSINLVDQFKNNNEFRLKTVDMVYDRTKHLMVE